MALDTPQGFKCLRKAPGKQSKILAVDATETDDLPLRLPKIEQNRLPADCGHPLKTARDTSNKQVSYQNPASAIGENKGISWFITIVCRNDQLKCLLNLNSLNSTENKLLRPMGTQPLSREPMS